MPENEKNLFARFIIPGNHAKSDYFGLIKELIRNLHAAGAGEEARTWQAAIARVYEQIADEIATNLSLPAKPVSFGTSGWRGILGKELFCRSVGQVSLGIVEMYETLKAGGELARVLGVDNLAEAQRRGCVLGFDNRFGGEIFAKAAADVLTSHGFAVHYAGESTTGVLSASVLRLNAAFSINLTPSHNPLDYGGFKFNAADAGPAAAIITSRITENSGTIMAEARIETGQPRPELVKPFDSLAAWIDFFRTGTAKHGLDYDKIISAFATNPEMVLAIDCVHGASRIHIDQLFKNMKNDRLIILRADRDYTFGGIAPEPSSVNMQGAMNLLAARPERLKLGVIIDPDADRIRFTDGTVEIDMNQFGAMSYHYLHEYKGKKGLVAKNVATSNFANAIATALGEEVYESRVGFKEFKPVIDRALVCFEESDGITVIGHTPEKDAYAGLFLAMDMLQTQGRNLGEYLAELETSYGHFYPGRDGITVSKSGKELLKVLAGLEKHRQGTLITVGDTTRTITEVIDIDGRKMILDDGSWVMIRPSGTEPKIRLYVEARLPADKKHLIECARGMLREIGLID